MFKYVSDVSKISHYIIDIFVNNKELFHFSYLRYIENQIRSVFGMEGTPIKFYIRERTKDKE